MSNRDLFLTKEREAIIPSLLYADLYKFSMLQFYTNRFPNVVAKYELKVRSDFEFAPFIDEINYQLDLVSKLRFTKEELDYLKTIRFLKPTFINQLRNFSLDRNYVHAYVDEDGKFQCYSEGPLGQASMFEIYVLAILQEIRSRVVLTDENFETGKQILATNIHDVNEYVKHKVFKYSDFSCRRAASVKWLDYVIFETTRNVASAYFTGTSCVYYAMKYNIKAIGTIAHEAICLGQAIVHPFDSQEFIFEQWNQEYHGDLGIALSDTFGVKYFIKKVFHRGFAMLFAGVRHDSGDPVKFGEDIIQMYKGYGIDPITKQIVFSDGLTFKKAFYLNDYFNGRILTSYGIGTKNGNDLGVDALQIVMKMVEADGKPVIKIADTSGKGMCKNVTYEHFMKEHVAKVVE